MGIEVKEEQGQVSIDFLNRMLHPDYVIKKEYVIRHKEGSVNMICTTEKQLQEALIKLGKKVYENAKK